MIVGALGTGILSVQGAQQTEQAQQQTAATAQRLGEVADPLAQLCASDPSVRARVGAACDTAAQAAANPAVIRGETGPAGRGIAAVTIRDDGHLWVTYSDGAERDTGQVAGPAGVGISAATIVAGHLVLTWSDGHTENIGQIVGEPGRGITTVAQDQDAHLIVTYSDGATADLGALPTGPQGAAGPQGPAGGACREGFTAVDAGPVTAADGTTYRRSTVCVDPASAEDTGGEP